MKQPPIFFWHFFQQTLFLAACIFLFSFKTTTAVSCGNAANYNSLNNPYPTKDEGGKTLWDSASLCNDAAAITDLGILKNCSGICGTITLFNSFPEGGSRGWTCWGAYSGDIYNPSLKDAVPCTAYFTDDAGSCAKTNNNKACDGKIMSSSFLYETKYNYVDGQNNGQGKPCQCRQSCSQYGQSINANIQAIGGCAYNYVGIKVKKPDSSDGYLHGASSTSGDDEGICVQCIKISPPWFQIINGNIYAAQNIINVIPDSVINRFLIRKSDDTLYPGIPISLNGLISVTNDQFSERNSTSNIKAKKTSGFTKINGQIEDFTYFSHLINYQDLESCRNGFTRINDGSSNGSLVCKTSYENNNGNYTLDVNQDYYIGGQEVYFIEGNLTITGDNLHKITIDKNSGFLAFVVKGDIIFNENLGYNYDSGSLKEQPSSEDSLINGVFISSGDIKFPTSTDNVRYGNSFTDKPCGKQIVLGGTYIGWGQNENTKGFVSTRTFSGCMKEENNYIDYNSKYPIITIFHIPYLLKNIPNWMKNSNNVIFETY